MKQVIILAPLILAILALGFFLLILVIRALRKYLRSGEVRKEKGETRRSLGEAIKAHRMEKQMTQEFVAESLGVSRQAVSKWESGASDPSTSNLLALAKLFDISGEELLQEIRK
ncbi:MAG: helix-turn-helix transcriptional regulator [Oscillospiraceae bacterium]|nr:helix-turn-helix transcriptional regulator [Oscillospiraceae bacterium]